MELSTEYFDDILVRMAYHSSAIEGNTISLPQTVSIIMEGTLPSDSKSIRKFYEIKNHKQTFEYMLSLLEDNSSLTLNIVKEFHALLTDKLRHDRGQFKSQQNAILGTEFKTASSGETPFLMAQWVDNTNFRLDLAENEVVIIETLADTHIQFERIHPFLDSNGKTGRIILMFLIPPYLNTPVVVRKKSHGQYMEFLGEQNLEGLSKLFTESLKFEKQRMTEFN